MSQQNDTTLSVTYESPANESFAITNTISAPPSTSVTDKVAYLAALRQALASAQGQINKELTERMEEDKARDAASVGADDSKKKIDDVKEEENYGEEVQEDED